MTEKKVWDWIIHNSSDEWIATIGQALKLKIPGFRQIDAKQKSFKVLRPRLMKKILMTENLSDLKNFFNTFIEDKADEFGYKDKSTDELMKELDEKEVTPSFLFMTLLSSEDEKDIQHAIEIYTKLEEEGTLNEFEDLANKTDEEASKPGLESELKQGKQEIETLGKKLNKSELKNTKLKTQMEANQNAFQTEKKQLIEEKKKLTADIQVLRSVNGNLKSDAEAALTERDASQKKLKEQHTAMKQKDVEISRLNALVLKLETELSKKGEQPADEQEPEIITDVPEESASEEAQIDVAVIGDPKNSRVLQYQKFNLTIIEASEIEEEKHMALLDTVDNIWLLTYKIPRSIKRKLKHMLHNKTTQEFATFVELENYMKKG